MLKGNSIIRMNAATIYAALDDYLNKQLALGVPKLKVTMVATPNSNGPGGYTATVSFDVSVSEVEAAKPEG